MLVLADRCLSNTCHLTLTSISWLSDGLSTYFCLACDEKSRKRDIGITLPAAAAAAAAAAKA